MIKTFAITLLVIYLFNVAGYTLLFQLLINKANTSLITRIDNNNYNDKDLLEVKLPLHLPYLTNQQSYERVDGSISFNGTQYNYVKRKVVNDTLHILCLPNNSKTQLYNAKAAYANEVNNVPASKKSGDQTAKKSFQFDQHNTVQNHPGLATLIKSFQQQPSIADAKILPGFTASLIQPPDYSC